MKHNDYKQQFTATSLCTCHYPAAFYWQRWLLSGELPGFKIGPAGQWRVRSDELAEYIETRQWRGEARKHE